MGFCVSACASGVAKKASAPGAAALCATAAFTLLSGEQPVSSPAAGGLAGLCRGDPPYGGRRPYTIPAAAEAVCRGTAAYSAEVASATKAGRRARGSPPACNRLVPRPCVVHVRGSVSQRHAQTSLRVPPGVCATVFVGAHGCAPAQVTDSPGHGALAGGQGAPRWRATFSASGWRMIPFSVMMAVTFSAGVTSKAGL